LDRYVVLIPHKGQKLPSSKDSFVFCCEKRYPSIQGKVVVESD